MKEEKRSLEIGFFNTHTVYPSRPPEILLYYPKKMHNKQRSTRTMISMPNILNAAFLLVVMIGLAVYDISSVSSDRVSASSSTPLLLDGGYQIKEIKKSCDRSRMVLEESHGFFSSGPEISNYTQNTHCEWLIKPTLSSNNGSKVTESKFIFGNPDISIMRYIHFSITIYICFFLF